MAPVLAEPEGWYASLIGEALPFTGVGPAMALAGALLVAYTWYLPAEIVG